MGTPLKVMADVNLLSRQSEWLTSALSREWFLVSKYSSRSPIMGGNAAVDFPQIRVMYLYKGGSIAALSISFNLPSSSAGT